MKNRTVEAGLILAVSAFTMLSVGTYISDMNHKQSGQSIADVYQKVEHWIVGHTMRHSAKSPTDSTVASHSVLSSSGEADLLKSMDTLSAVSPNLNLSQVATGSKSQGTDVLNSANDARMLAIGQTLAHHMTAADWTQLMSLLQSTDVISAQQQISDMLETKLSPSDVAWLKANFHGKQAFDRTDVVLLQQTLQELKNMFTPSEQQLLQQQLEHFGVALNG